ncbi:glycosyltransferase family 2 protein [Flavobacterium sp. C3NV]|uniref:glycosyltransferase family 2 protein n=1 Tax=Flavobacterium sp. C3NV TaxID=3393358 RepID=UPI00398FACF4
MIDKNNNVFLSICIPTYNRDAKLLELVKGILMYEKDDIEVVVVDNCSTDNTSNFIGEISDNRLKYVLNDKNVGGAVNLVKSLTYGRGEFVMLCADRDRIDHFNISLFIEHLSKDEDLVFGQAMLNLNNSLNENIFEKGFQSVLKFSYKFNHPTGWFAKNSVLKDHKILEKGIENYGSFPYLLEILRAELSMFGRSKLIWIPLMHTATMEYIKNNTSSFSTGENVYFHPKNYSGYFNTYIQHLYKLNLTKQEKRFILKKIYFLVLNNSTIGFKKNMNNAALTSHYSMATRNVSVFELINIYIGFNRNFFNVNFDKKLLWKIVFLLECHLLTLPKEILKKV